MTNYNDGRWWGWNGGECPVHPQSEVEIWDATSKQNLVIPAEAVHWPFRGAFRVIREHREPREWVVKPQTGAIHSSPPPVYVPWERGFIRVREVIE